MDALKFCTNCGAQVPQGAKFCLSCGTQLSALAKIEEKLWKCNITLNGSNRTLGGKMRFDGVTLSFTPHAFDRLTGGKGWSIDISDIVEVNLINSFPYKSVLIYDSGNNQYHLQASKAKEIIEVLTYSRSYLK